MKQAIKKKSGIKPSAKDIMSSLGMLGKTPDDLSKTNADKPIDFIPMPPAFENAIKLPGFQWDMFQLYMVGQMLVKHQLKTV